MKFYQTIKQFVPRFDLMYTIPAPIPALRRIISSDQSTNHICKEDTMYKRWHRIVPLLTVLLLLLSACGTPELAPAAPAAESSSGSGGDTQAAAPAETSGQPEGLKDVPRNRTLIMAGLGGEHPGGFTDIELFNSYPMRPACHAAALPKLAPKRSSTTT
jgi:hypothetical protein